MVASISKLKSNSFKLALAVSRSRNVSKEDSFSAEGYAPTPRKCIYNIFCVVVSLVQIYILVKHIVRPLAKGPNKKCIRVRVERVDKWCRSWIGSTSERVFKPMCKVKHQHLLV